MNLPEECQRASHPSLARAAVPPRPDPSLPRGVRDLIRPDPRRVLVRRGDDGPPVPVVVPRVLLLVHLDAAAAVQCCHSCAHARRLHPAVRARRLVSKQHGVDVGRRHERSVGGVLVVARAPPQRAVRELRAEQVAGVEVAARPTRGDERGHHGLAAPSVLAARHGPLHLRALGVVGDARGRGFRVHLGLSVPLGPSQLRGGVDAHAPPLVRGVEVSRGGILRTVDEDDLPLISPRVPARHPARGAVPSPVQRANLPGPDVDALNGAPVELLPRRVAPGVVHDPLGVRRPRPARREAVAVVAPVGQDAISAGPDLAERAPQTHGRVFVANATRGLEHEGFPTLERSATGGRVGRARAFGANRQAQFVRGVRYGPHSKRRIRQLGFARVRASGGSTSGHSLPNLLATRAVTPRRRRGRGTESRAFTSRFAPCFAKGASPRR